MNSGCREETETLPDADTARRAGGVGDDPAAKPAAVGLIPDRRCETLAEFRDACLDRRRVGASRTRCRTSSGVVTELLAAFDPKKGLPAFTAEHADPFRVHYPERELAPSAADRRLKFATTVFADA